MNHSGKSSTVIPSGPAAPRLAWIRAQAISMLSSLAIASIKEFSEWASLKADFSMAAKVESSGRMFGAAVSGSLSGLASMKEN
jgi:hypothetical protein